MRGIGPRCETYAGDIFDFSGNHLSMCEHVAMWKRSILTLTMRVLFLVDPFWLSLWLDPWDVSGFSLRIRRCGRIDTARARGQDI